MCSVVRRRGGDGGGRRKPFHANRSKYRLPSHMGDRSGSPGGFPRPAPAPGPAARLGPAHSRRFAPNFIVGGKRGEFICLSPFPPPVSPRSWVQPLPVTLPGLNETLPSFIYLSTASLSNPPAPSLTNVDDGVRPHRNALKYPGEKPEHQHFHFQPLAQHISPGLVERQQKRRKKAQGQVERGSGRGGEMPRRPPPLDKKNPKFPQHPKNFPRLRKTGDGERGKKKKAGAQKAQR